MKKPMIDAGPMWPEDLDELDKVVDVAAVLPSVLRVVGLLAAALKDGRLTLGELIGIARALADVVRPALR